ncbi:MAG: IPT/TIG domain-containing protein, partial [bacterium]
GGPSCDLPHISSLNPNSGSEGSAVYINGSHFGDTQGSSYVTFYQNKTASVTIWSDAQIKCGVPVGAESGNVKVTTSCGTSNGLYFTVTDGGCPYVSPWVGGEYLVGNNILAASEDTNRAEQNVTDHFRLEHPLDERDGSYWLQIREFEQEHTWLDGVRLLAVDHPQGLNLGVNLDGEMFLYRREVLPVACTDSGGIDCLGLINTIGDGDYEGFPGEWLTVDFGHVGHAEGMYVEVVADLQPPPPKDQTIVLQLRGEHEWEWQDVALLHPRQNWATHLVDLSPWVGDGSGDVVLRLYWLAQHKVDYVGLVQRVPGPMEEAECVLESAVHSEAGPVTDKLLTVDGEYAELVPDQQIELSFVPAAPREGFKRYFVVVATGYYVTEGTGAKAAMGIESRVPTEFSLAQNCPNPFNPTTSIQYSVVSDQSPPHVTLKIFNLLGQEVRTLVNEPKAPGLYTVTWDGKDNNGRPVAVVSTCISS